MAELSHSIGASEYDSWLRYFGEEPFGPLRDNIHAGIISATIVNGLRAALGSKSAQPATFKDFLLKTAATAQQVAQGLATIFRGMATPTKKQQRRIDKDAERAAKRARKRGQE